VRRCHERPARLSKDDLTPLRNIAGDAALDYVLVLGGFHFINRMADLLHVDSEFVPDALSRIGFMRRVAIFVASKLFTRMDLVNRPYDRTFEQACREMQPAFRRATGRDLDGDLDPLRARPKLVEVLRLALEERDVASSLPRSVTARVHALVEEYLPSRAEEADGFHARPADPLEAFVFVGTRYAARTTPEMIQRLRGIGYDDVGILDLATAVADANQWARLHRLLGLPRDILAPQLPRAGIARAEHEPLAAAAD